MVIPTHNGTPRLILFDIDGTLLLTGGVGREATLNAMEEIFGTSSRIQSHQFGGKTDWQTLCELLEEHGHSEASIGEVMAHYQEAMQRHMSSIIGRYPTRPCPGAVELVEALRQRDDVLLGLVTGNVSTTVPIKLRAAGFEPDWFSIGAYGSEARNRDVLPAMAIARAEQRWGHAIDPRNVIVIGDTPADVQCARAVGAVAVGVRTGFCQPGELEASNPDYVLDDLTTFIEQVLDRSAEVG